MAVDGSEHAPAAFSVGKSHHCSLIRCWVWASGPVEMWVICCPRSSSVWSNHFVVWATWKFNEISGFYLRVW